MIGDGPDPGVCNPNTVRVLAEILRDLCGTAEGLLGVDDPPNLTQHADKLGETGAVAAEIEALMFIRTRQSGEKLPTKERAHHPDREEVAPPGGSPPLFVRRQTADGDDTVDVRVKCPSALVKVDPGLLTRIDPPGRCGLFHLTETCFSGGAPRSCPRGGTQTSLSDLPKVVLAPPAVG